MKTGKHFRHYSIPNNISVISWQSVLLVEETGVPRENNQPVTCKSILQSKIKHNNGALRI
jgi:hypothetical protein